MSQALPDPDAFLLTGTLHQADLYRLALEQSEKLLAELRQGRDGAEPLQSLLALFNEIAALEARLAGAPRKPSKGGRHSEEGLREALAQVADLRVKLHKQIQLAEGEAVTRRDQIAPQMDQVLRARRMQRAYNQRR